MRLAREGKEAGTVGLREGTGWEDGEELEESGHRYRTEYPDSQAGRQGGQGLQRKPTTAEKGEAT